MKRVADTESYYVYYEGPESDHFKEGKFFNPWNKRGKKGLWDVLKWRMNNERAIWPETVENAERPKLAEISEDLKVTYIGHATFLIQTGGLNILVDPVFSERASPFSGLGPKRVRKPFVPIEDLPPIQYVFVSHNHYDHLDQSSLRFLSNRDKPVIITPLGNGRLIKFCTGDCSIVPLDWGQEAKLGADITLTITPAQHWSRRSMNDINRDLWGGFFLKTAKGQSVYYSGDTGFHAEMFQKIRETYGAPDIALLPIGAYEPRWFMKYSHMNPAEAVQTYEILEAKRAIAFHFETFQLTDEAFDAPRTATQIALQSSKIEESRFLIPYPGDFLG